MNLITSLARTFATLSFSAVATLSVIDAATAAYPDRPITLTVGFAVGGPTDVIARLIAAELGTELKQSVIVENKPGAGSNIAAQQVARSTPDGYRLLMVAVTSAINQTLYADPGFDLVKDFSAIGLVGKVPSVLVVHPSLPVQSVEDLIRYGKEHPDKLNFGSSGNGTSLHIAGEMFRSAANFQARHVPYRGSAPADTALVGGEIDFMFENVPTIWPFVKSGKVRALAVSTKEHLSIQPSLPTMAESGFPDFDVSSWYGLLAPASIPPDVQEKLASALSRIMRKPEFRERVQPLGIMSQPDTPDSFRQFIAAEVTRWAPIVKASGASIN